MAAVASFCRHLRASEWAWKGRQQKERTRLQLARLERRTWPVLCPPRCRQGPSQFPHRVLAEGKLLRAGTMAFPPPASRLTVLGLGWAPSPKQEAQGAGGMLSVPSGRGT